MEKIKEELIGLTVTIVDSKNSKNINMEGKIVDETKNMIIIKTKHGEKKLIKNQNTFGIEFENGKEIIEGSLLVARPQDRIKFKVRKI